MNWKFSRYILCTHNPSLGLTGVGGFSLNMRTHPRILLAQGSLAFWGGGAAIHTLMVCSPLVEGVGSQEIHSTLENTPSWDLESWQEKRKRPKYAGESSHRSHPFRLCWCRRGLPRGNSEECQSPSRSGLSRVSTRTIRLSQTIILYKSRIGQPNHDCKSPWREHSALSCPPPEHPFQQQGFLLLSSFLLFSKKLNKSVEHLLRAKRCIGLSIEYKANSPCPSETVSAPPRQCPHPGFPTVQTKFRQHSPPPE